MNADPNYDYAAALWVAAKTGYDADEISGVTFASLGSECETCGYDASGVKFQYGGKTLSYEFEYDVTVGRFLEEAIGLLGG